MAPTPEHVLERDELELLSDQLGAATRGVERIERLLNQLIDDPREPVVDDATAGRLLLLARWAAADAEKLEQLAQSIESATAALHAHPAGAWRHG